MVFRGAALACLSLIAAPSLVSAAGPRDTRPPKAVVVAGDGKVVFPSNWLSGEIRAKATQLDTRESARSKRVVALAMSAYPQSLVDQNLVAVYVVRELSFYGLQYGGTNSSGAVYIANRGERDGFTDEYLVATFHHEFSSILLRNYASQFDERSWREANGLGDFYRKTGTQSIKDGTADTHYSPTYHVFGFLNQYGTSSVEEDFNTFAEALFSGDLRFWSAVAKFPRVAKKKDLAIAFYHSLDPQFTEEYFRSLARV